MPGGLKSGGAAPGQQAKDAALWAKASLLSAGLTVGSSLRSAGSSLFTGIRAGYEQLTHDHSDRERVTFVKFGRLHFPGHGEGGAAGECPVLLLAYAAGFQVWSLQDGAVKELVSRRDGCVRCLEPLPLPLEEDPHKAPLLPAWPLLAAVCEEPGACNGDGQAACCVRLYSLRSHAFVHSIEVPGEVLSVTCSRRVLLVAMRTQVMAYDTASLAVSYSAVTYPAPCASLAGAVPLALGPRWLAHASNQPVQGSCGVAQPLPVGGGGASESVQALAGQAARSTGRQLKSMGEAGYRLLSSQMSWRGNAAAGGPPGSPAAAAEPPDVAGTVIVRDLVSRAVIAHFRAHTSPLLLLRFDASGSLLVTASVHGHSVNVFALGNSGAGRGGYGNCGEAPAPAAHLFHLSRGLTPALIQDGTTHLFRLAAPGAPEGPPPHLAAAAMTDAQRRACQPVKLAAVGRARPGGLLNGGLPGSAAASAAVNLYNGSAGSVLLAASFQPRSSSSANGCESAGLEEDIFVASDSGLLVRHCVSLQQQPQPAAAAQPPESPAATHRSDGGASLAVEPVEQWQIGRRLSWPEREEPLADVGEASAAEGGAGAGPGQAPPWSAYAETCIPAPPGSDPPLWADPQFHILEMQTAAAVDAPGDDRRDGSGGQLLAVEAVPTKRVNPQGRASLAPVIIEGQETAVVRGTHSQSL